jgi:hypothetical protein
MKTYLANVLISLDQFASALLGGRPGETLSGRAGSAYNQGKLRGKIFCPIIDVIMHIAGEYPTWRGHCQAAIAGDIRRASAVIANQSS